MAYINLLEILNNCPEGTKLYSPMIGECELKCINNFIVVNSTITKLEYKFFKDGTYTKGAECMLFPSKDQRDWNKFDKPFVEGDVIVSQAGNIVIYSHFEINSYGNKTVYYKCILFPCNNGTLEIKNDYGVGCIKDCRYATEEEKERLYKALEKEGYKYNPTTKNVEKIQKKFDISTLKPFDKVLVRQDNISKWCTSLFEKFLYKEKLHLYRFKCLNNCRYTQCIPYEGNEYLLDTTNEPNDFFVIWE